MTTMMMMIMAMMMMIIHLDGGVRMGHYRESRGQPRCLNSALAQAIPLAIPAPATLLALDNNCSGAYCTLPQAKGQQTLNQVGQNIYAQILLS